jgi:hypothetical protein
LYFTFIFICLLCGTALIKILKYFTDVISFKFLLRSI